MGSEMCIRDSTDTVRGFVLNLATGRLEEVDAAEA